MAVILVLRGAGSGDPSVADFLDFLDFLDFPRSLSVAGWQFTD
jgi:hypothetical protein